MEFPKLLSHQVFYSYKYFLFLLNIVLNVKFDAIVNSSYYHDNVLFNSIMCLFIV